MHPDQRPSPSALLAPATGAEANATKPAAATTAEERLVDFRPLQRVVALTKSGAVVAVDPMAPRQFTDKSSKIADYEVRPFGAAFQIVCDIYRMTWTAIVEKDPTTLHASQVMPVFLRPIGVYAP